MKTRIRAIARWGLRGLVAVALLVALYASVFFFPYPLFAHHDELSGFAAYSDRELPDDLEKIFEDARRRVEAMPLYRGADTPRIFICRSQSLFAFLNGWAGRRPPGQGLVISAARSVFLSPQTIEAVGRRNRGRPAHSRLEGSLAAAIAHEVAHVLIFDEVGFWRLRRLPAWKLEGYADYSANLASARADREYDLRQRIGLVLDDRAWRSPAGPADRRHFRWHLMVEYLASVEGLEFSDLMKESITEDSAWGRMLEWYEAARLANGGR